MKPNEKTTRDVIAITAAVTIVGVANITLSYVEGGGDLGWEKGRELGVEMRLTLSWETCWDSDETDIN